MVIFYDQAGNEVFKTDVYCYDDEYLHEIILNNLGRSFCGYMLSLYENDHSRLNEIVFSDIIYTYI